MAPDSRPTTPPGSRLARLRGAALPIAATALLYAAIAAEAQTRVRGAEAASHQGWVRRMAQDAVPLSAGDWLGRDVAAPAAAISMLRPNVLVTRSFENLRTGETASVLFVQCSDARDLLGHYPPVCYPAHGYTLLASAARDWRIGGAQVEGRRYRFAGRDAEGAAGTVVDNFMVLPGGGFARDMDGVDRVATDARLRHLGVAEVQVVTDGAMSDERRDEVFAELVELMLPLVQCVQAGTDHE